MSAESTSFVSLIQQTRAGDSGAAAELIQRYEPALRREVRMLHTNPSVQRIMDTSDLVQSVLGNFFIRLAAGQFDLEHPEQLVRLLATMARNKILNYSRSEKKRADASGLSGLLEDAACPSEIVANKDLYETVQRMLSPEEQALAALRARGESWQSVSESLGGTPESLRKQFARAMNRVADQLELDRFDE